MPLETRDVQHQSLHGKTAVSQVTLNLHKPQDDVETCFKKHLIHLFKCPEETWEVDKTVEH